jgi:hypothetical protein
VLLTLPGSTLPTEDWLSKIWFDKWVHIGLFALMVIFWSWPLVRRLKTGGNLRELFIQIAGAGLIYGIGMEYIQKYFIRGRSFDLGDIFADAAGCLLGALFGLSRYIKK